jgi:altronate dehydratase
MKDIVWGMFSSSELIDMGDGNLQKGIEIIKDDRWEIIDEYIDAHSGETYYKVEREKIDEAEFDENSKI